MKKLLLLPYLVLICTSLASAQQPDAVETRVQLGHLGWLECLAFSPDNKYALTGSWDNTIKLWDVALGREIRSYDCPGIRVKSVTFTNDGKYFLASGSNDIYLWDFTTGKQIKKFTGHNDEINKLLVTRDDKFLISCAGQADMTIKIWDITKGELVKTLAGHKQSIHDLDLTPDEKYLLSTSFDQTIVLWDLQAGTQVRTFTGHTEYAKAVDISNDGKFAITAGDDEQIIQWDLNTGAIIKQWHGHRDNINDVRISPDDKTLLTGGEDEAFLMWDLATGTLLHNFEENDYDVHRIDISANGKYALTIDHQYMLNLYNLPQRKLHVNLTGFGSNVRNFSFSPDGKLFSSVHDDKTLKIWETSSGRLLRGILMESFPDGAVFSADNKFVATGKDGLGNLIIHDVETGAIVKRFYNSTLSAPIKTLHFTKDGKYLVIPERQVMKLISTKNWTEDKTFGKHRTDIKLISLSPDSKQVVTVSDDDTLRLWDIESDKLLKKFVGHTKYVNAVKIHPDGKRLIAGGNAKYIDIWDLATGNLVKSLEHPMSVRDFAISPDEKNIAVSSYRGIILWELAGGSQIKTIKPADFNINALAYTPDGRAIYSAGADTQIRRLDVASGKEIVSHLPLRGEQPDFLTFTPDHYYSSTKKGSQAVHYVQGNKIFLFDQFDLQYNRPDIILERLGNGPDKVMPYKKAYEKRLRKMGFNESMFSKDFHMPEASLINVNVPVSTSQKQLKLTIEAKDSKYNLDRINVYINDVPVYGTNGISVRDKKTNTLTQDISVELSAGKNKIMVSVLNEKGVESLRETIETTYDGLSPVTDLFVVSIGVSDYDNNDYDLKYAAKDATDLTALLQTQQRSGGQVKVLKFLDKEANRENILKAKDFLKQSKVDDQVILFVAGHGLLDDSLNYYIATADVDFSKPALRGLKYEQLESLIDNIPARKKLMLIDACHSGEVDKDEVELVATTADATTQVKSRGFKKVQNKPGALLSSFELMQALFSDLRKGTGAIVISSASGIEFALESDVWKNGVFTYSLLEGIKTKHADLNHNSQISVTELKEYVTKKVDELTNGKQHPTSRKENVEFDFRVW